MHPFRYLILAFAALLFVLAGCDAADPVGEEPASFGHRLLVAESGEARVHVLDLTAGVPVGTVNVSGPIRAYMLPAGPGNRFAALAPTNGPIQVIDGGIFRQGGRLVEQAPALHPFNVPGENLVHLTRGGSVIAGFYDGTGHARFFDASVLGSSPPVVREIYSGLAHHGTALAMGDVAVVTHPVAGEILPTGVRAYRLSTGQEIARFDDGCPRLHGEAKGSGSVTAFGCSDGLFVVRPSGSGVSGQKVPYPASVTGALRSGTLHGHESVAQIVAHIAGGGQNVGPALYDPATNQMRMLEVPGRAPYARGYRFSTDGRHLLVLGLDGTLHVYDASTFALRGSVPGLANALPDPIPQGTLYPQVIATARHAYVSDPAQRRITEVDLTTRQVTRTMALPFVPGVLTLVGED